MKLYRFSKDYGRHGYVDSLFLCEEEELKSSFGRVVEFQDFLGKHSEDNFILEPGLFEEIYLSDESIINIYNTIGRNVCGINPLEHIEMDEDENCPG